MAHLIERRGIVRRDEARRDRRLILAFAPPTGTGREAPFVQARYPPPMAGHFKDDILDKLARQGNVAQFISFGPDLAQRHAWIRGLQPGHRFDSLEEAVAALLGASPEESVNIRSWQPDNPKSRSFLYGRREAEEIVGEVRRLAGEGLYTI